MPISLLTSTWNRLRSRTDIESVVRELFGEHALHSSSLPERSSGRIKVSMRLVVNVRLVLDLQRTYLQSEHLPERVRSYLVGPELIYFVLRSLVDLKCRLFPPKLTAREDWAKSSFIAQTILSGVRVLMLQSRAGKYLYIDHKREMDTKLRNASDEDQEGQLADINKIIWEVCIESLPYVKTNSAQNAGENLRILKPACGEFELPPYSTGLYPLEPGLKPKSTVTKLSPIVKDTASRKNNWLHGYWTIFDLIWALEAALIDVDAEEMLECSEFSTLHVSPRSQECRDPNAADEIQALRESLLPMISQSSQTRDDSSVLKSLPITLLSWHGQVACRTQCIGNDDMRDSLGEFVTLLESRKTNVDNDIADNLNDYTHDWVKNVTSSQMSLQMPNNASLYIVGCPELHIISHRDLHYLLKDNGIADEQHIANSPPILRDLRNVHCQFCEPQKPISRARLIEPLSQIMAELEHRTSGDQTDSNEECPTSAQNAESRPSMESYSGYSEREHPSTSSGGSGASMSVGTQESARSVGVVKQFAKRLTSSTHKQSPWKTNPDDRRPLPTNLRFCFTSSGTNLLLWESGGRSLVNFELPDLQGCRHDAHDIRLVAGGKEIIAVISEDEKVQKLLVYHGQSCSPRSEQCLDSNGNRLPITSIAVSRDDHYVVLAYVFKILLLTLEDGRIINQRTIPTSDTDLSDDANACPNEANSLLSGHRPPGDPRDQVINFDCQSQHVIVASRIRTKNGELRITVLPCSSSNDRKLLKRSKVLKLSSTHVTGDQGLRSVHYDSKSDTVILAAFIQNYEDSPLIPLSKPIPEEPGTRHSKVQGAALSPCGRHCAMMYYPNQLCHIRLESGIAGSKNLTTPKQHRITKESDLIAVAMPQANIVYAFWIADRKLCLLKICPDDDDKIMDIHDYYDNLVGQA